MMAMRRFCGWEIGVLVFLFAAAWVDSAPIKIHAFDIYPSEYLDIFNIIYDQELSNQFLQLYHRFGPVPDRFYADARYEFPDLEKRIRGIVAGVQQKAKHLSARARDFLELISKHVEIVLIGSESKIHDHVKSVVEAWAKLDGADRESYRDQFPDSAIILDSERYRSLLHE